MTQLQFGGFEVDVDTDGGPVGTFIEHLASPSPAGPPTHHVIVRRTGITRLIIDETRQVIRLTLPSDAAGPTILIGVLQAVTRGVAYVERSGGTRVLLHGSAFTTANGAGVAVLDGGLGQGKTSLALAMARAHGQLLVDEFTFAHTMPDGVVLAAAPTLPWHVRPDMAPYIAPAPDKPPLRYPNELRATVATAPRDATLHVVLIPDQGLRAGRIEPVEPDAARHLLRWALTDHLCKLADPKLDHVSIFADAGQVVDLAGCPLADQAPSLGAHDQFLQHLVAVPAFRVGIGAPGDLPASVAAAGSVTR